MLGEAALRTLAAPDGELPDPLAVLLPQQWMPASPSTFFAGLDVDFVDLSSVGDLASSTPSVPVALDDLTYPEVQTDRELDAANFAAVADLVTAGNSLQSVLPLNDAVGTAVSRQALASLSYAARSHAGATRAAVQRSTDAVTDLLGKVTIEAPPGVNLSSASGRLPVAVVNDLDQPVTVRIEPTADPAVQVARSAVIEIGANSRADVLLTASTTENGVHDVTLALTTAGGAPLGASVELPIRSVQVSNVIWLFLGGGVALLFGAIGVRLVRRVRAARRRPGDPVLDDEPEPTRT